MYPEYMGTIRELMKTEAAKKEAMAKKTVSVPVDARPNARRRGRRIAAPSGAE